MGLGLSIGKAYQDIPASHWVFESFQASLGILANTACLLYVIWKLKINVYIRKILLLAIAGSLVCQTIGVVSVILINALQLKTRLLCSLMMVPKYIVGLIASHFAMAIAIVRYYLATKTAQVEAINHTWIHWIINGNCLALMAYTVTFILILILDDNASIGPKLAACYGRHLYHLETLPTLIISMTNVTCIVGMIHDGAMARFLQRRNQTAPVEMAVWSSGVPQLALPKSHQNEDDSSGMTIPVKATIVGNIFLMFSTVTIAVFLYAINTQTVTLVSAILGSTLRSFYEFYMPFLVVFAIKSNEKTKKKSTQKQIRPPNTLQFHDSFVDKD